MVIPINLRRNIMESLTIDLIEAVKNHKKEFPELSDGELSAWMDEVVEDAVSCHVIPLEDYRKYKQNPYGYHIEVLKHV